MPALRSFWRPLVAAAGVVVLGLVLAVSGSGLIGPRTTPPEETQPTVVREPLTTLGRTAAGGNSLDAVITALQARLRRLPDDHAAWADLGLAYVQHSANTVDPSYYAKAEDALDRSLSIKRQDNFQAMTGMSALAAGRHDFKDALRWARMATDVNPYNSAAWGAKGDALLQLGRYQDAFRAIQRENDLQPGFSAFARASYAWELRGDLERARATMELALEDADTGTEKAFAHYYLGELDFNAGKPKAAREHYQTGLDADSSYPAVRQGMAKALWALGEESRALEQYADLVASVPSPGYVMEYGELLESLGKSEDAQRQFDLFATQVELFEDAGVQLDVSEILFFANHGDPGRALSIAKRIAADRPFVEVQDALAWALYKNEDYAQALDASRKAMRLGTKNARFYAHSGLIKMALGREDAARRDLTRALEINPWFSPLLAPRVRAALEDLGSPTA